MSAAKKPPHVWGIEVKGLHDWLLLLSAMYPTRELALTEIANRRRPRWSIIKYRPAKYVREGGAK